MVENRLANVLIAGTESARLNAVVDLLSANNYTARVCESTSELEDEAAAALPDLIIVDATSNAYDGYELVAGLRRRRATAAIPEEKNSGCRRA